MELIQAKCTNCGANIEIDPNTECGICPYCNTAYITQKAIVNYKTTVINNNNIHAENITFVGADVSKLIKFGKNCWQNGDYEGAYTNFTKVLETDPDNEEAALYRSLCVGWREPYKNYLLINNTFRKAFGNKDFSSSDEEELKYVNFFLFELDKFNCATINRLLKNYDANLTDEEAIKNLFLLLKNITCAQSFVVDVSKKIAEVDREYERLYVCYMKDLLDFYDVSCDKWRYSLYFYNGSSKLVSIKHPDAEAFKKEQKRLFETIRRYEPNFKYDLKEGCYVATAVYGSYDCSPVWVLRRYRDDRLGKSFFGRLFIRIYYAVSPVLVKLFGKSESFKNFWRKRLDKLVEKLKNQGFEDTPYKDKNWRIK